MANIVDVAKASGVSKSVVSYVLNGSTRKVHPETRARVLEAVEQLGYHPSAPARRLSGMATNTYGIVVAEQEFPFITDPYYSAIIEGIMAVAFERKQDTLFFTGHVGFDVRGSLPVYCDGRCDGLLVLARRFGDEVIEALIAASIPFVLVNDSPEQSHLSWVDAENVSSAKAAAEYLIQLGHKRIGYFAGDTQTRSNIQREQGFRVALADAGIAVNEHWVLQGRFFRASGEERARTLFHGGDTPTALFCANDAIALGAMTALQAMGRTVPGDVSVIGFDDIPAAAVCKPTADNGAATATGDRETGCRSAVPAYPRQNATGRAHLCGHGFDHSTIDGCSPFTLIHQKLLSQEK